MVGGATTCGASDVLMDDGPCAGVVSERFVPYNRFHVLDGGKDEVSAESGANGDVVRVVLGRTHVRSWDGGCVFWVVLVVVVLMLVGLWQWRW